jgi:predicted transcriptional regulator YdeE
MIRSLLAGRKRIAFMLKIGDFSKVAQVSVKRLRYYSDRGLLPPAYIDRFTGYRYYTLDQLPRLNRILALMDLGLSLEQIQQLLQEDLPVAELQGMIRLKKVELSRHIQEEQARLARLEARLNQIAQEGTVPDYEVILKPVAQQTVAGIRAQHLPHNGRLQPLFKKLQQYLKARQVSLDVTQPFMGIYYDADNLDDDLTVEAAVPITQPLRSDNQVSVHVLRGTETMACTIHHGPYGDLPNAYNALLSWVDASGYQVVGPNRDLYYIQTQAQDKAPTVTEVQFPVRKRPILTTIDFDKETKSMEPKIVTKPAFTVVGMLYKGKNENNDLSKLWDYFIPRIDEIEDKCGDAYGVCGDMEPDGIFHYLAGIEVSQVDDQPNDMNHWSVPEQTYAAFPCTLKTIHDTFNHAHQNWLPQSGYKRADGPDFEFYPEEFNPEAGTGMFVYIPVTK